MYKCCIFDLDGTLVNSIYALKRSVDLTLGHFGLGPVSIKDTKQFVGDGYKKLVERSLIAYGDKELTHIRKRWMYITRFLKTAVFIKYKLMRAFLNFWTF